jgi:voltage-gated sodium channel
MKIRARLVEILETPLVRNGILVLIIVNAITLGLSTSETVTSTYGGFLFWFDDFVVAVFVVEIALKLFAYGWRFFLNPWNVFDITIVSISLMPAREPISALRGLRVIRAMRVLSAVPQMRKVIQALLDALPGMGAVIVLLSIVYYIFAVMATMLYGDDFPQWFGTVGSSLYSLFQIMTLESWSMGIVRPVMEVHPTAWAFFVPFIVLTAFAVLNLFIGLLVNTMQSAVEAEQEAEFEALRNLVREETNELDTHILELQAQVIRLTAQLGDDKSSADGQE